METTINANIGPSKTSCNGQTACKASMNRFWNLARKMLIENRKNLLLFVGTYLGGLIVLGLWGGWLGGTPSEVAFVTYFYISSFVSAYAASKMFSDMSSKEGRISMLMTPASLSQKFWLRLIAVLPGMLVLAMAGFFAFMYSIKLGYWFDNGSWLPVFYLTDIVNLTGKSAEFGALVYFLSTLMLFNLAVFVLGSIVWIRKSFIKTVGAYMAFQMLLIMVAIPIFGSISFNVNFNLEDSVAVSYTLGSVLLLIDAGMVYLTYILLKRKCVV